MARPLLIELAILIGAFLVTTALAMALGAANLGVAAGIGQIAFIAALTFVLLRR